MCRNKLFVVSIVIKDKIKDDQLIHQVSNNSKASKILDVIRNSKADKEDIKIIKSKAKKEKFINKWIWPKKLR